MARIQAASPESRLAEIEVGRTESQYQDFVTNAVTGGIFLLEDDIDWGRTAASLRGSVGLGPHTVVAGAEYEDAQVSEQE